MLTPGAFAAGSARLYVPLALVAGTVVAAPTLLAHSLGGRLLGVAAGTALLAGIAWIAWRRVRPANAQTAQVRSFSMGEVRQLRVETGGHADLDADALLRRLRRSHALVRYWPAFSCGGLAAGGAIGALMDSFLATVMLAAGGFLLASAAIAVPAFGAMRRLRRPPPAT